NNTSKDFLNSIRYSSIIFTYRSTKSYCNFNRFHVNWSKSNRGGVQMANCIEMNGLQKLFGKKTAIKNIDLHIEEGEIFGLLGPSGAGKTMMIKMLTGELNKTSGEIQVLGKQPS